MFDKMKQLYEMQKQARELQKQLETIKVEKKSRDGLLSVKVNGAHQVESITIDSSLLTSEKKNSIEQSLATLVNDAFSDIQKQAAAQAASLMRGLPGF